MMTPHRQVILYLASTFLTESELGLLRNYGV